MQLSSVCGTRERVKPGGKEEKVGGQCTGPGAGRIVVASNVVVWLKLEGFGICLPKTIPENLELSILCFCDGQSLVLQE